MLGRKSFIILLRTCKKLTLQLQRKRGMKTTQTIMLLLLLMVIANLTIPLSVNAQISLPDEAKMPDGKGAWVIEQKFKTSIGGAYTPGYIYIIIQSDGIVFHRKFFQDARPATPWCKDKFTAEEMREIRDAVARSKPTTWDSNYGPFINVLAPFRALTLTMRDTNGKIAEYATTLWRFYDLPLGLANLANAIDAAGDLAFANCAKSLPNNNEPVIDKLEKGTTIYAVNGKGNLLWYNHSGFQNGDAVWANNGSAKNVGYEWAGNTKIFKGDPRGKDGVVYTVSKEGYLSWYKHNGYASGSTDWINGKNVGIGFDGQQVFAAGGGVIYMIDNAGNLYWYKHLGYANGDKTWLNNGKGIKISNATNNNWRNAQFVFSGSDGVIYSIDNNGNLYWNKHLGFADGTIRWSGQTKIGSGWQNLRQVISSGDGIIYAVTNDGTLLWQKHTGFSSGAATWANNGTAKKIGSGWNFNFVF